MMLELIDARTQAQIVAEMNGQVSGVQPNLVLYLPFNEGSGNTTTDLAGGYVGTLGDGAAGKPTWVGHPLWSPDYAQRTLTAQSIVEGREPAAVAVREVRLSGARFSTTLSE